MSAYVVVGASSGIGRQLAVQLAASGNQVYATYYKHKPTSEDTGIEYHHLDVMEDPLSFDFLPDSISGLIYCPGSILLKSFERIRPAEFVTDYQLQVVGAVKVIQALLPRLKKGENASILLFSTVAVEMGLPYHSLVSASKGAIQGLTKALAAEFSPTIRVNCLAPSLTDTPLAASLLNNEQKREANAQRHPLKRFGTAKDIADLAEFLISDKASWITGQVYHVDGGFSSLKT